MVELKLHLVNNFIDLRVGQVNGGVVLQQGCKQPLHLVSLDYPRVFQVIYVKSDCRASATTMMDPYSCQACAHSPRNT